MSTQEPVQDSSDSLSPEEEVLSPEKEVLQIIEQAIKDGVTHLNLSNKGLTRLPPEIGQLRQLITLNLSSNKLSQLPSEIAQLRRLTYLYLFNNELRQPPAKINQLSQLRTLDFSGNQLTQLPPEMGLLSQLRTLYLSGNKLSQLPPEIGQLSQLRTLYLSGNKLSQLPAEIGQLSQLKTLSLFSNQLSQLPAEIGQLSQLIELNLSGSPLSQLPVEIGQLNQLTTFDLSWNQLRDLPAEIGQLSQLKTLDLKGNQLRQLPTEVGQLRQLTYLDLRNNRLPIPHEILSRTNWPTAIIEYYLRENRKPLNEAKVVLVGQGRVGKSSLVKRLIENRFDENEAITKGIAIKNMPIFFEGVEIKVNIWDFGGQEIMHATHQFFMTIRTLYLLVLDAEEGEAGSRLDYWLKLIESFGQDSPIIVVSNKCDLAQLSLDRRTLKQKYPTIRAFAKTSCKTGEGIAELARQISSIIGELEHVRNEIPVEWLELKAELEGLKKDYITYNDYVQHCQAKYITRESEQGVLIRLLHDLGVVLSFQDDPRLRDTSVLNPTWVTGAVYKIINAEMLQQSQGVLQIGQLDEILERDRYPREKHLFIIELMRKFELCFEFEGHTEEKFLIPDLLSEEEPALNLSADGLDFEYRYDFLPGSVISRFMVRMNRFIFQDTYWRNGVLLVYNKNRALVKAVPEPKRILISIVGPLQNRWAFWRIIYEQFDSIHTTIKGLNARKNHLNPQANLLVAGVVEQIGAVPSFLKREWIIDFNIKIKNIRLRVHPQKYYPTAFLLGQRCYRELPDYTEARQAFVKAHEAISAYRSLIREEVDHKKLSEECVSLYEMLVHCFLVEGDESKAFQYAAVAKGRAFVNTLARSRFDFSNDQAEKADFLPKLEQVRKKRRQIEYLENQSSLDMGERREKLDVLLQNEAELWREMGREFPLLTATLSVPTLSVEQARQLAQELDATLVEYYRHAEGWCAFVIRKEANQKPFVSVVPLPDLSRELLAELVEWRNDLHLPYGRDWLSHEGLERLYQAAIAPLKRLLTGERVLIAPFERLHLLPLAAAYNAQSQRYLAEEHTLSFVPSLTALYVVNQERKLSELSDFSQSSAQDRVRLLSVAYPGPPDNHLPNVLDEAKAIVERLSEVATIDTLHEEEATPDKVIEQAPHYDMIHFGCHGKFDVEKPSESGLRLAGEPEPLAAADASTRDGTASSQTSASYLTVQRIITELNLKPTRLATLAACLTGEVKLEKGEEHVGLLQAMMVAGVQTVVASLWHVDDAATRTLFESFYYQEAAINAASHAMRNATHLLRQQPKWKHPYYWAAFAVNGFPSLVKGVKGATEAEWPPDLLQHIKKDYQRSRVRGRTMKMNNQTILENAEVLLKRMHKYPHKILSALKAHPLSEEVAQQRMEIDDLHIAKALDLIVQDNPTLQKLFPDADVDPSRVDEEQDKKTRDSDRSQERAKQARNEVRDLHTFLESCLQPPDQTSLVGPDHTKSGLARFVAALRSFISGRK